MAEQKLNDAVSKMMDSLDRKVLRDFQKSGYVCAAKCFDNKGWNTEQIQNCVERCQMPMQQVQGYLQNEMQSFQNRLQRCAMECQDRARDSMPSNGNPSEAQMAGIEKDMQKCFNGCVDTHLKLLPTLEKRVTDAVSQVKQQTQ
ncbi:hypothetical protein Poli38472_009611 [Pythium oligandrum]|uniref:Protein FAM136A n=1 Tax=Pythium oligandrum TaxID=41045 RepID=A0A8K1CFK9_PYTOL|nr:hypothetical protein Poli38472_009611 [Pythium oligandrum]|eukprot:TMW62118.1 hypothetical protein Poli38472_009611 [Pythium oligandrum]